MELDKTTLVHDVSADLWTRLDPFGEKAPFDEQDPMIQFNLKAQVLPVVDLSIPHVEEAFKAKVIGIIDAGHAQNRSAEEILLSLTMELS